jgi:hypothetical protein
VSKSLNHTYRKYTTGFTAGNLLLEESLVLLNHYDNPADVLTGHNTPPHSIMPFGSEASKKRIHREVLNRLKALRSERLLLLLKEGQKEVQNQIMLYATAVQYPIIADFMLSTLRNKWMHLDVEVDTYDFKAFFYSLLDTHTYLEEVSADALSKLSSLVLRIFKEAGYMNGASLVKIFPTREVAVEILKNGDQWFLDALLLNEQDKVQYLP